LEPGQLAGTQTKHERAGNERFETFISAGIEEQARVFWCERLPFLRSLALRDVRYRCDISGNQATLFGVLKSIEQHIVHASTRAERHSSGRFRS
jgi:hypothetical protein